MNRLGKEKTNSKTTNLGLTISVITLNGNGLDISITSLPGSSVHGESPGKNTGVGCHAFLQGIFPTQASNSGLLHCKWILYCLSHQESPRILKWVVYPFSRESSWLRNWTGVSCIAGRFFTSWTTREAKTRWTKIIICLLYLYKDDKLILALKELIDN